MELDPIIVFNRVTDELSKWNIFFNLTRESSKTQIFPMPRFRCGVGDKD